MKHSEKNENFERLKTSIRNLYSDKLNDAEAEEATRNLIGFTKILLEIKKRSKVESKDEQSI